MVRTAVVDDKILNYISTVASENKYAVGLILGQPCLGKDYIIHFAKTPPCQINEDEENYKKIEAPKNIDDFNNAWVADHAKQATRMLSGGLYVLGIFIVSPDDIFNPFHSKIKSLLSNLHSHLNSSKYLFASPNTDKLVFYQSSKNQKYCCKSYDVLSHSVQNVDIKSMPKKWINVECEFMLDKLFYLSKSEGDWPLEKHIKVILDELYEHLNTAIFLYDGELKDPDDSLDSLSKKKNRTSRSNKSATDFGESQKPFQVSIYQSEFQSDMAENNIINSGGHLKLFGKVATKLWLQPKITVSEASVAVKEDILRSLTSRLEMHWDSLTEEENSEDINSIHEPPRRVLVDLPDSEIAFFDYLFPGEGPQEAKVSLEELLDVKINKKLNIKDIEGQADTLELEKYYKNSLDSNKIDGILINKTNFNNLMYIGLVTSIIVLVISILFKLFMWAS